MADPAAMEAAQISEARLEYLGKPWAITEEAAADLTALYGTFNGPELAGRLSERLDALTEEKIEALTARINPISAAVPAASGEGEIAVVPLRGPVTPRGSFFSMLFGYGGGGLQGFRKRFSAALADDNVKAIIIDVDSPGGVLDLVPETAADIRAARGTKPIVAIANTMAASAAYWIASQADEVVVTPSGQVGSVGVFCLHEDISERAKAMGVTIKIIRAGRFKAEANPYEPLSKAAETFMQSRVDAMLAMFVADVAAGRKTDPKVVQASYGEGRCLLAEQALAVKMVDRIETFEQLVARLGGAADDPPATAADLEDEDDGDEARAEETADADADAPADSDPVEGDEPEADAEEASADNPAPEAGGVGPAGPASTAGETSPNYLSRERFGPAWLISNG